MGNTWEVWVWIKNDDPDAAGPGFGQDYYWEMRYGGSEALLAVGATVTAKGEGCGCVKVEWR